MVCQVRPCRAGATARAPNASHTSSDIRPPVSSANGTSRSPRCPPAAPNASPPTDAAMKPLPCSQAVMPLNRASASSVPRPIVRGKASPSSRRHKSIIRQHIPQADPGGIGEQHEDEGGLGQQRTVWWDGANARTARGPWVSTAPATTNVIGAVMSLLSSRADSVPPGEDQRRDDSQIGIAHLVSCRRSAWQLA